jgi:hypothetical protein
MKPSVGVIHELPLPIVLEISYFVVDRVWIQQRRYFLYPRNPKSKIPDLPDRL